MLLTPILLAACGADWTPEQSPLNCLTEPSTIDCVVTADSDHEIHKRCHSANTKGCPIQLNAVNKGRLIVICKMAEQTSGKHACHELTVERSHVDQEVYVYCGIPGSGKKECEKLEVGAGVKYFCEDNPGGYACSGGSVTGLGEPNGGDTCSGLRPSREVP